MTRSVTYEHWLPVSSTIRTCWESCGASGLKASAWAVLEQDRPVGIHPERRCPWVLGLVDWSLRIKSWPRNSGRVCPSLGSDSGRQIRSCLSSGVSATLPCLSVTSPQADADVMSTAAPRALPVRTTFTADVTSPQAHKTPSRPLENAFPGFGLCDDSTGVGRVGLATVGAGRSTA